MCITLYHNSVTDVQPTTSSRLSPSEVKVRGSIQETERWGEANIRKAWRIAGPSSVTCLMKKNTQSQSARKPSFQSACLAVWVCVCLKKSIEIYWSWYIFFSFLSLFLILGKVQSISKTVPCFLTLSINFFYFSIYQVNTLLFLGSF